MSYTPHNKYSPERVMEIIQLFNKGVSPTEIARKFNTYNTTIRRILLRNGITPTTYGEVQKLVKDNPFKDLSSEAQYWIGILAADGYIYKNRISLALKDKSHVEKFNSFLGGNLNIKETIHQKYLSKGYRVSFRSNEVAAFLKTLGLVQRKTFSVKLETPITWPLFYGILDGDGCITYAGKNRLRIEVVTASTDLKTQLIDFLNSEDIHCTCSKWQTLYYIRISTQKEIYKVYQKLLPLKYFGLERKFKKFINSSAIRKLIDENTANSGKPKS